MSEEKRKPRCHNCKYSSKQFKVVNLTHIHCENEKAFELPMEEVSPWDTLRVFNDTCEKHEFKMNKIKQ